ncbi:uncharacterized protein [Elaeis guineensis]|uniref:tRNA (guanine-N(7)-)-methyltransferase non-catalytic subunit n=1 Tax=Elaeis guineensis var. tenera TaxID=51953 RepID=A0A6I9QZP6_ELAGV|nr:tRNA (guanine-N(7)-)-methyltransferase non-catalytic subunit wdr4 isoform X1 [Elaeis guineensis]
MEENLIEEGESSREGEVAPALIVIHPRDKSAAVAVGPELRVYDIAGNCPISLSDDSGGPSHSESIRAIGFGANGSVFASAGDDKLVKIWMTDSWHCTKTVYAEKRVSAVAVSHNGQHVVFADKFGLVWAIALGEGDEGQAPIDNKAVPILGHYCSIITSLKFSPDGWFIASADRDFKIRITVFPKRPRKGAHEIQSFCLGHTDFVSCLAFARPIDYPQGFLLSGGGDSTVRLWDFISGRLLHTCDFGAQAGLVKSNGTEMEGGSAVIDVCASCDGSLIAVAIQSLHGIILLNCDFSARTLSIAKVVTMEESYVPTSLGLSDLPKHLWMVMGVSNIPTLGTTKLLSRVRVVSGFLKDPSDSSVRNAIIMGDSEVPGSEKLLEKLQGSLDVAEEEVTLAATAAAVKTSVHNLLIKKQYSLEKRELQKRSRNDKKLKQ